MRANLRSKRSSDLYRGLLAFIVVCCSGCGKPTPPAQSHSVYFDRLKNKHLYAVDSVVSNTERSKMFVFLFNYYDCQSCVVAGLRYAKQLDSLLDQRSVVCIASMVDSAPYQAIAEYYDYIYFDADDKIRKELKFVPTPQMLLIDKNRRIISAFMPRDTICQKRFLKELLEKYRNLP